MSGFEKWIMESVHARTGALATARGDNRFAVTVDQEHLIRSFLDTAVMKVLILTGIIQHDGLEANPDHWLDLVPPELHQACLNWVLGEWFRTIGETQLGNDYLQLSGLPMDEGQAYRFSPGTKKTATRKYTFL